MKTIADLVANHREYCARYVPNHGVVYHNDLPEAITIEEYNRRVQSHLTMTVNRIEKLSQGK